MASREHQHQTAQGGDEQPVPGLSKHFAPWPQRFPCMLCPDDVSFDTPGELDRHVRAEHPRQADALASMRSGATPALRPDYYQMGGGLDLFAWLRTLPAFSLPWAHERAILAVWMTGLRYARRCLHKGQSVEAVLSDVDKTIECFTRLRAELELARTHQQGGAQTP